MGVLYNFKQISAVRPGVARAVLPVGSA